ncbi:MAG: NAD(P)H-dependent oxidoreductase [Pseudomonadota bacterium]
MTAILKLNASARLDGSTTRTLTDDIIRKLSSSKKPIDVIERDLAEGLPFVDDAWIAANFTPDEERSEAQRAALAFSDKLIDEMKRADILVIGAPIYNFSVPAALKAWIDLICRARKTFRYSEQGPVGLLENKRAIIAAASGGTEVGSRIDFATGYLRHLLNFVGVETVDVVSADRLSVDPAASLAKAQAQIAALAPA